MRRMVPICAVLMLSPCGAALSVDAWRARRRDPGRGPAWVPPWSLRLIQIQLAVIQAGQRPAGEHDPVPARQEVHRGTVRVDDLDIRSRSWPGQDSQDIIMDRPAVPRCRGRRAVTPCHAA